MKSRWLFFLGCTQYNPHWLPSKGKNNQWQILCQLIGPNVWRFEEKTTAFDQGKKSSFPPRQCKRAHMFSLHGKISWTGLKMLPHPPYSPNLAQSDYFLFPNLNGSAERYLTPMMKSSWQIQFFGMHKKIGDMLEVYRAQRRLCWDIKWLVKNLCFI